MLKLHKMLAEKVDHAFGAQLKPTENQRAFFVDCKNKIRDHLRKGIEAATVSKLGMERRVTPRFRTQGSWSYNTCVRPAQTPPQEMDWDFGVYLPVTVWEENGPPHVMAKLYFELVERLLQSLCNDEGWKLVPGKNTCIRIQLSAWAHIDLPLYAAPEEQFALIVEKSLALESRGMTFDSAVSNESLDIGEGQEQSWEEMDSIVLATRNGEWKESDPEAVTRWFKDRVVEHGPQLKQVCRYVKAWRDHHWGSGGPSSVCLMIVVAQNFERHPGRDDLALERAAEALATALREEVREIAIDDRADNFNRLTPEERVVASQRASELRQAINQARSWHLSMKGNAVQSMRSSLGPRIPDDHDLIESDSSADVIRLTPASQVKAPAVKATKAG